MNKGGCKTGRVKESPNGGCKIGKKNAGAKKYKIIKQAKARQAKQEPEKKKTKFRVVREAGWRRGHAGVGDYPPVYRVKRNAKVPLTGKMVREHVERQDAEVADFLGGIEDRGFVFNKKRIETDNAINSAAIPARQIGVLPQDANQMDFFALMNLLPTDIKQNIGGQVRGDKLADPSGGLLLDLEGYGRDLPVTIGDVNYNNDGTGFIEITHDNLEDEWGDHGYEFSNKQELDDILTGRKNLTIREVFGLYLEDRDDRIRYELNIPEGEGKYDLNATDLEKEIFGMSYSEALRKYGEEQTELQLRMAVVIALHRMFNLMDRDEQMNMMDLSSSEDPGYKITDINNEINELFDNIDTYSFTEILKELDEEDLGYLDYTATHLLEYYLPGNFLEKNPVEKAFKLRLDDFGEFDGNFAMEAMNIQSDWYENSEIVYADYFN